MLCLWPLILTAGLFALSSIPGATAPQTTTLGLTVAWVPPDLQNALHLPAFALLAWLWFRALRPVVSLRSALMIGLALTLAYAICDEWRQAYVPGRYPSATDILSDSLGALIAALVYRTRHRRDPE